MSWDEALGGFDEMVAGSHHVDMYWFPHTDRMLTKRNNRLDADLAEAEPLSRWRGLARRRASSPTPSSARSPRSPTGSPRVDPAAQPGRRPAARPRARYSDVAHRVFTAPRAAWSSGRWSTPSRARPGSTRCARRRRAIEAVRLADQLPGRDPGRARRRHPAVDRLRPRHRSTWPSTPTATPTTRRTSRLMEPILRAHDGRPHWGKVHTRTAADLAPAYPRFGEFLALRDRLDPDRVFANAYLRRVLGLTELRRRPLARWPGPRAAWRAPASAATSRAAARPGTGRPRRAATTTTGRSRRAPTTATTAPGQRRGGVELAAEDHRHPAGQHVAGHAAADAGDHPHQRRRHRAEPVVERLERPGHAEQPEPEGVEDVDRALHPAQRRVEQKVSRPAATGTSR